MKKKLAILILMLSALYVNGQSVDNSADKATVEPMYKHEYSFGCFHIFAGAFNNGYEYHFSAIKAIRFETEIIYRDNLEESSGGFLYNNEKNVGGMLQLQYKYYILGDRTIEAFLFDAGALYMGPFIKYRYHTIESYGDYNTYSGTGTTGKLETDRFHVGMAGVVFGGRLYFLKKIVLDMSVGGGLRMASIENNGDQQSYKSDPFDIGYSGIAPTGNFTIGIRF